MGLLDLPAPALAWIDETLAAAGLPPLARLLVWAALASVPAMACYRLLSPQQRIAALKARIVATRRDILACDGEFSDLRPLLGRSIRLSLHQLGLVLAPSVVASLPVLVIAAWLGSAYGFELPEAGERVNVRVMPPTVATQWRSDGTAAPAGPLVWPLAPLHLVDTEGNRLLSLPLDHAVPVVHQRAWWNALFGNPLGYLPEATAVRRVEIELPRRRYLNFGPAWLDRWETVWLAAVLLLSLIAKVALRIH